MSNQKFPNKFNSLTELITLWLKEEIDTWDASCRLDRACSYALDSPGKRFRPVLTLASAELLGIDYDGVKNLAVAFECVHTFSLVHDDLPSMDDDELRRGKPSTHIEFDEATALLAGDALLARAFLLLSRVKGITAENYASLLQLVSDATLRLCRGQSMDLLAAGDHQSGAQRASTLAELEHRHLNKTGALIVAALCAPLYFGPDKPEAKHLVSLRNYGENLGLLFQITDDILDATETSERLGKPSGSDLKQGTPTYLSIYGLERSQSLATATAERAIKALSDYGTSADFLRWITNMVQTRLR